MRRPRDSAIAQLLGCRRSARLAFARKAPQQPADFFLLGGLRLHPIADLLLLLAHVRDQRLNALGKARHRGRAFALIESIADGDRLLSRRLDRRWGARLDVAGKKVLE